MELNNDELWSGYEWWIMRIELCNEYCVPCSESDNAFGIYDSDL